MGYNNLSTAEKWDFFFNKVIPKKFIIMIIATIFAWPGITVITGTQWIIVAGAYAGFNFGQKILGRTINGNNISTRDNSGDGPISNRGVHLDVKEPRETAQ